MILTNAIFHIAGCDVGWVRFQTKCYMFSHTSASWADAEVTFLYFLGACPIISLKRPV